MRRAAAHPRLAGVPVLHWLYVDDWIRPILQSEALLKFAIGCCAKGCSVELMQGAGQRQFGAGRLGGATLEVAEVRAAYPGVDEHRLINETTRRLIDRMIRDVLSESRRRLDALNPADVAAIRGHSAAVVAFSPGMAAADKRLKEFLFERMYRHYRVNRMTSKARRVVRELFELLFREPDCLPQDWRERARNADERRRARLVADYIAGMTDRFALLEHRRLLDVYE